MNRPENLFRNALVLTGPTGSGKTALGLRLAERLEAEIVAMDSMTLYRGLDIGTAKPSAIDRLRVPHHLIDVLEPWESASVAWWLERAGECCLDIEGRGKRVLFVGGTPLYLKALLRGLFDGPPADAELRDRLSREALEAGPQVLYDRLAKEDPLTAARLHPNDVRRVIRALEVRELTDKPISAWQQQWTADQVQPGPTVLWLDRPRQELYSRINARVREMVALGLMEEARRLRQSSRPLGKEAAQAIGYKEMFVHLEGKVGLEETTECIQVRSRNFAKRQITWFRHLPECLPVTEQLTFSICGLRIDELAV